MAEIQSISGKPLDDDGVDQEIVAILEGALEVAKRGELVNVAVVGVLPNGKSFDSWSCHTQGAALVGALQLSAYAMCATADTSLHPEPDAAD